MALLYENNISYSPIFEVAKRKLLQEEQKQGKTRPGHINLILFGGKHSDTTILIAECNIVTGFHKHTCVLHNIFIKQ